MSLSYISILVKTMISIHFEVFSSISFLSESIFGSFPLPVIFSAIEPMIPLLRLYFDLKYVYASGSSLLFGLNL